MSQPDIRNLSFQELAEYFKQKGQLPFRTQQVFEWIYQKGAVKFDEMTNLSVELRAGLKKDYSFAPQKPIEVVASSDKTKKFLFKLKDGETVETVLIPTSKRSTVCVSTQAGCKFGCRFCASGIGGLRRNLSAGEIIGQILYARKEAKATPLSHIVFMGVGEPMDNYENLLKVIRIVNSPKGLKIAARRITISTCGLIPEIKKLATEGLQIELAVSLHGFDFDSRNVLMPVNRKYPIDDLIEACREYAKTTKRQITFEYILIKDVTCSLQAAGGLKKLLKGILCKMNLIPYNKVSEFDHQPPSYDEMMSFRDSLVNNGIHATIRRPRGRDVSAACGQLRHASK